MGVFYFYGYLFYMRKFVITETEKKHIRSLYEEPTRFTLPFAGYRIYNNQGVDVFEVTNMKDACYYGKEMKSFEMSNTFCDKSKYDSYVKEGERLFFIIEDNYGSLLKSEHRPVISVKLPNIIDDNYGYTNPLKDSHVMIGASRDKSFSSIEGDMTDLFLEYPEVKGFFDKINKDKYDVDTAYPENYKEPKKEIPDDDVDMSSLMKDLGIDDM